MTRRRWVVAAIAAVAIAYVAATAARFYFRKYYIFAADYARWTTTARPARPAGTPIEVFFFFTDHYEPDSSADLVRKWADRYRALANRHHDADGRPVQHTWFYPGEQHSPEIYSVLRELTSAGLGEVELHFHHDHDTEATLRAKFQRAIADFQEYGFLKTVDGRTRFAFIHGNWGLDNSNGPRFCGVPTELKLLREVGCFADFTFPSIYWNAQPPFVNTIYAAKDDDRPKSYARRLPLAALFNDTADLMIFEGPLVFSPSWNLKHLFLDLEDGDIHPTVPVTPRRVDDWVRAAVHVPERPDWIFIKVWGHSVPARRATRTQRSDQTSTARCRTSKVVTTTGAPIGCTTSTRARRTTWRLLPPAARPARRINISIRQSRGTSRMGRGPADRLRPRSRSARTPALVHPDVVDLEPCRKGRRGRVAALCPPDREVQQQVLGLVKRIRRTAILVDRAGQIHFVQPLAVNG